MACSTMTAGLACVAKCTPASIAARKPGGAKMISQDALLAALVTFCVCLLALLFFPVVADQLPDLARTAIVYGAVLVGVAAVFEFIPRKRH